MVLTEIVAQRPAGPSQFDSLIRASVRLRIEDDNGNSVGSGTIVDARSGEALIITCGHIFRDAVKGGHIWVDLFGPGAPQGVLGNYVRVPRIVQRKISRRALFARDGWRCVYCGSASGRLTLDHVIPRSRGGGSEWENVVTSCAPCNLRKGNRLLHEVKMELAHPPRPPAPVLFIRLAAPKIPARWERYLAAFGAAA